MREIKFRAWDADSKTMHINNFAVGTENYPHSECDINIFYPSDKKITIMQYTGTIVDPYENSEDLFEGDIILSDFLKMYEIKKGHYFDKENSVSGNGFYLEDRELNKQFSYGKIDLINQVKIIGNIYENPELLEEGIK